MIPGTFRLSYVRLEDVASPNMRRVFSEHDAAQWGPLEPWRAELADGSIVWVGWSPTLARAAVEWGSFILWRRGPRLAEALAQLFGAVLDPDAPP